MSTTYSSDADILAVEPSAASYLPSGETTFDRLREQVYADINRRVAASGWLYRSDASPAEAKHAEVCGVLAALYREAASRTSENGTFWALFCHWQANYHNAVRALHDGNGQPVAFLGTRVIRG